MTNEQVAKLVSDLVSDPLADLLKQIRQLRKEMDHQKRLTALLLQTQKAQRARTLVRATEDDHEYD